MRINYSREWFRTGIFLVLMALIMSFKPAYSQVTITTVISPPYEKPLNQLPDQIVLTLLAMDYLGNTYLTVKIEGDNGILIQTPEGTQTQYFEMENAIPLNLTGSDLEDVFSSGKLSFSGITENEAYTEGLPAGSYSICFRAWSAFGSPVSNPEPSGCAYFSIVPPPVNVTLATQVTPPYPFTLDELPDKTMVTMLSSAGQSVKLFMQIIGDNGITIRNKPGFSPGEYIDLQANVPYMATGLDLSSNFEAGNLIFSGIPGKEVMANGLPEGRYRVCFQAFTPDGVELTPQEPSGCSQFFEIRNLDPPVVINPQCGVTIKYADIPSILFSWTPSPGAPVWSEYILKIVEMPDPDMNPAEAMAGATEPAFFEEVVNANSFFYGPGQPMLDQGQSYAFVVIARDEETGTRFKNNGASEVCSFTFGDEDPGFVLPGISPVGGTVSLIEPTVFPGLMFAPARISGTIKYLFHNMIGAAIPLKNTNITFTIQYVVEENSNSQKHILSQEEINQSNIPQEYLSMQPGRVLSTTMTDDQGRFETVFLLPDSLGVVAEDLNIRIGYGDVGIRTYNGNLSRVVRVIVESPYFLSPSKDLIVDPNDALENIVLITHARDYGINVSLDYTAPSPEMEKFIQGLGGDLSGMNVFLYKSLPEPPGKPENECFPDQNLPAPEFMFKKVVAAGTTDSQGRCNFMGLVKAKGNFPGSYYLFAQSDPNSTVFYESFLKITGIKEILSANNTMYIGDNQVWDQGYEYNEYPVKLDIMSRPPRVYGKVVKGDKNLQPVEDAEVKLYNLAVLFPILEQEMLTDSKGDYSFDELNVAVDANGNLKPMPRVVKATMEGYEEDKEDVLNGATLKLGQQAKMRDLVLELPGIVKGSIVNEDGEGVSAQVYFLNGESTQANPMFINMQTNQWNPAQFKLHSPLGFQFLIADGGENYFMEGMGMQVQKGEQTVNPNPIVLKKKQHRVEVIVREGPEPAPGMFFNPSGHPVVAGATVRIKNRTEDKQTNTQGIARFEFGGNPSNDQFVIEVESPEGKYYKPLSQPVHNAQFSKEYNAITVYIEKASFVSGYVRFDNQPVKGASVRLDQSGGKPLLTKTNKNGFYKLEDVPIGDGFVFVASKPGYLSHTRNNINVPASGNSSLDFVLGMEQTMDISTLLGFTVEVDTLIKQGSNARISGRVVEVPSNNHFRVAQPGNSFPFYDVMITPDTENTGSSGKPLMKPLNLPIALPGKFEIIVNGEFAAISRNLTLTGSGSPDAGIISAKVVLLHGDCFMDNAVSFEQDSVYLADGSGKAGKIQIFSADGSNVAESEIPVCNQNGLDIRYKLHSFDADGMEANSWIKDKDIFIRTTLHTNLQNAIPGDLKIDLGQVKIGKEKAYPVYGNKNLEINLEKWILKTGEWALNSSGFYFKSGNIETHMVTVPFNLLSIKPGLYGQKDRFSGGNFLLEKINMEGITDIFLEGNTNFYYENASGHWKLIATPSSGENYCGYIPALPMMEGTDRLLIGTIILSSDGLGDINLLENEVTLSGAVKFKPSSILVSNNKLGFPGTIDVRIPKIPIQSITLNYSLMNNLVTLSNTPFTLGFFTNGVNVSLNSGNDAFNQDGLKASGTLSEPNKYSINVEMNHNQSKTEVVMKDNEFRIDAAGNTRLVNASGEMHVDGNQWTNFKFSGDLEGTNGLTGRINLEIIGDIIADNETVNVNNIPSPFGNLSLTYDFQHKRLLGNLTINNKLGESTDRVISEGLAEVLIDGDGWYFVSGGNLDISDSPLIKGGKMAILFGSYPNIHATSSISTVFNNYSFHQKVPSSIQNGIEGFYTDGRIAIGLPIPDINIDMLVCHGKLKIRAYAGMNMGINLTGPANHYHIGSNLTFDASAKAGASALFGCVAGSLYLNNTYSVDGDYYSNGEWSLTGKQKFTMKGKIKVGGGVCCKSDCSSCKCCCGVCSCGSHSESASAGFNLSVTINRAGLEVCADTPLGDACY